MGDRLAHLQVLQVLVLEVGFENDDVRRIVGVARLLEADLRALLQPFDVPIRNRRAVADVDVAGLERDGARGRIEHEAGDQAVDMRQRLVPVVRVALPDHMAAAHPLLEDVGAGADRRRVVDVGQRIGVAVAMLRNDRGFRRRQRGQQIGRRLFQTQHDRVLVRRLDRLDLGEGGAAARMQLLLHADGERDIRRGEILAVVPLDPLAQLEGVGQPVRRDLPGRGEQRLRLHVVAEFEQALRDAA